MPKWYVSVQPRIWERRLRCAGACLFFSGASHPLTFLSLRRRVQSKFSACTASAVMLCSQQGAQNHKPVRRACRCFP